MIKTMRDLVARLNTASRAYYQENREVMTDYEYDALYDKLVQLERDTGIHLAASPTRNVGYEIVSQLEKAPHSIPMLSLDKTKDVGALESFLGEMDGLLIWKLDGLSIALEYNNGRLHQALTRGNGQMGEDVTHNARVFANIPLTVPYKGRFFVRGEAVITFADFEAINIGIESETEKYKNPRNLCSGTVRQLNSEVASKRRVYFYAFGCVNFDELPEELKSKQLEWLDAQGFDVVAHKYVTTNTVADAVESFKAVVADYPVATDGLVLTFDDIAYSESLGATSKFPRDSIAFKWADDIVDTELVEIEWNPSRTGLINPVAIFKPVEIEGSMVARASLHNVSILRGLRLGIGDRIRVYKANMIIPQVAENLTCSDTVEIPEKCPTCGGKTTVAVQRQSAGSDATNDVERGNLQVVGAGSSRPSLSEEHGFGHSCQLSTTDVSSGREDPAPTVYATVSCELSDSCEAKTSIENLPLPLDSEVLICTNPNCPAKKMQSLVHFVSRDGLNIEGLSEQTLEKLVAQGIIDNYPDLFTLSRHEETIIAMEGFGRRSYDKLLAAIEKSKDITLPNFIYALGIRHVGLANAKLLCTHYKHDITQITAACQSPDYLENLEEIKGFGEAIAHSLHAYFSQENNVAIVTKTLAHLNIQAAPAQDETAQPLTGLTFVITGDVQQYKNRKALQAHIESLGGKVTGSVTAKTSYLINNDNTSTSSKNKKAAQLGVPVITEEQFQAMQ